MDYKTRPISDRTWLKPQRRKSSPFTADWNSTQDLLAKEIRMLDGKDVVIEVDVREGDLRMDGKLKARAKAAGPAVRVAFESRTHGPMLFQCDRYDGGPWGNRMEPWQHNVRAIALTMEALRAAERHEAIDSGQQYAGFKAIEAKSMSSREAEQVIFRIAGGDEALGMTLHQAYRRARAKAHPDVNGGDRTLWDELGRASAILALR
ncbi:MAG: hypothetical protein HOV97_05295 [Nonomuraea sp.]|nr:hypothetical protein [Nonomuraea sp.]